MVKTLYTLINTAVEREQGLEIKEKVDGTSWIKIGYLPFSKIYLVTRDKDKALESAEQMNILSRETHQETPADFQPKPLSRVGKLKFYFQRYVLGNLSFFLGESFHLDDKGEKICAYLGWVMRIKPNSN